MVFIVRLLYTSIHSVGNSVYFQIDRLFSISKLI
jgi:hypothetical protein